MCAFRSKVTPAAKPPERYNQSLGERRAQAVRVYLVSQGVDASRLNTISYGEDRPKYDNSKEETRRLNRRAAMVVEEGK